MELSLLGRQLKQTLTWSLHGFCWALSSLFKNVYLFLVLLGLRCYARVYSLAAVCRLPTAVVSLLTEPEHWPLGAGASVVAAHGFIAWGSGL